MQILEVAGLAEKVDECSERAITEVCIYEAQFLELRLLLDLKQQLCADRLWNCAVDEPQFF